MNTTIALTFYRVCTINLYITFPYVIDINPTRTARNCPVRGNIYPIGNILISGFYINPGLLVTNDIAISYNAIRGQAVIQNINPVIVP